MRMHSEKARKGLALLMALVMMMCGLAGAEPAADVETREGKNRIPEVGKVISGFTVKEIRDYPLAGGQLVLFEHEKTGAPVLWIANEDTNRVFQIAFRTRPHDDKGIPHVYEHATLLGSEKYPSSSLVFNLMFQTYNTYLNASTKDAVTTYPVASLSEAQLLKLADYYVDSCFHPMIMKDESIFRTQAWHYDLPSLEGELTYEGVVYSEVTGATTLLRTALAHAKGAAFPGSSLSYSYGGLPEVIPELTWEEVKNFHDLYYHPSNSFSVLYGQLNDYEAFLALLDGEFRNYGKKDFPFEDAGYTPITEAKEEKFAYAVPEGTDPTNQSVVLYYILLPGLKGDAAQETLIDHLCLMLNQPGSVLQQSVRNRFPAAALVVEREAAGPDDAVLFAATGLNENDAAELKRLVDEALADAAENGFPQEMADSVMAIQQMNAKLAMENQNPVDTYTQSFAYDFAVTGDPFRFMDRQEALALIDEENQTGALKEAAAKWLAGNPLYTLTTTYPAPGEKEKQDEALKAKLAEIKAGMSEEELQAIITESNAEAKTDDSTAMIAELKAVGVKDLPEEIRRYEISDTTDENGIRFVEAEAGVDGIGFVNFLLDAAALPMEDLHWMRLFTQLLGQMDTDAHSREELDTLISRYLYSCVFGMSPTENPADHSVHPYLTASWVAMEDDLAQGYDLMEELIFRTQFTDTATLADLISARKTGIRSMISSGGDQVMLDRGLANSYPAFRLTSYMNYLEYYSFLEELEVKMAEDPEGVAAKLREVQHFFENRFGAIAIFSGDRKTMDTNRALARDFLMKMPNTEREPAVYELPVPGKREALIVDGNIQYNSLVATLDDMGLEELDCGLTAVARLVTDQILTPVLRDQMGVYTPMNDFIMGRGMLLTAYRDPSIRETFDVYASLADRIAEMEVDQDTLDGYIMNAYSGLAKMPGELNGALEAIYSYLSGLEQDRVLERMRQLKAVTPDTVRASAELYRRAWENGARSTAGSAGAIQANADLYDVILNPFGAKDASQTKLTDVTEGTEEYEAIRYMYENGFLAAVSEDAFGAAEAAKVEDLAAAFYMALGGTAGVTEEAVETLSGLGLIPADWTADTELTGAMAQQFVQSFSALAGAEIGIELPEGASDRALTRGELAVVLYPLFSEP